MSLLELDHLYKDFGQGDVLRDLCLKVEEGEFLTLLGPSGCGKTTILRIIAGLESPTRGRVLLDGEDITQLPPEKRTVNTVFQNYALFPHMNVEKNIAYGLRLRGMDKKQAAREVSRMLEMVALPGYEKRMPHQLSGGQRQRVAIARALVLNPRILLLDEPLGALDLQLRRHMQTELKNLQRRAGTTFIYITHDQEEAMNMSHRVGVMHRGRLEDLDTPQQIYARPRTLFSAQFIGQANLIHGEAADGILAAGEWRIPCEKGKTGPMALCLRPEHLRLSRTPPPGFHLEGVITEQRFSGGVHRLAVRLADGTEWLCLGHEEDWQMGDRVYIAWEADRAALVEAEP